MAITGYSDPVYDAIKSHLTTAWTATPIQWPNEEYYAVGETAFIKVEMHGTLFAQASIGANTQAENRWDREGTLWIYVAAPRNSEYSDAAGAALALASVFRGLTLLSGALEFLDANIGVSHFGDEEGAWFLVPVSIDWRHMNA